jgi:hypothetical protein
MQIEEVVPVAIVVHIEDDSVLHLVILRKTWVREEFPLIFSATLYMQYAR